MPRSDDDYLDDDRDRDRPHRRPRDDHDDLPPRRKKSSSTWIILLVLGLCLVICGVPIGIGLLLPGVSGVRTAANRAKSSNNLKQIGLACHNYNDTYNEFPNNSYGPDGKPLLSWRVHILPFVEQDNLYKLFQLDEPWDSPNNIRLLSQMPEIYRHPQVGVRGQETKTAYRGFSSPGAVFEHKPGDGQRRAPDNRLSVEKFKDGTSDTILVVEAADAVEWTKPDDLDASPDKPFPAMGNYYRGDVFLILRADAQVTSLRSKKVPESTLRALVTHSGGEALPLGWDQ